MNNHVDDRVAACLLQAYLDEMSSNDMLRRLNEGKDELVISITTTQANRPPPRDRSLWGWRHAPRQKRQPMLDGGKVGAFVRYDPGVGNRLRDKGIIKSRCIFGIGDST